jgi:peptide/nickel transport system substrate-binding protein
MRAGLLVLVTSVALTFLSGCGGNEGDSRVGELKPAKGGRYYGGVFRLNESEYIKNLFPHSIVDVYSYRIANNIYEGLLKFDQETLSLTNSLAESYTVDESNTVYTFKLKDDVYFHDDPAFKDGQGRKLTAEDVAYSFTQLSTQTAENQSFHLVKDIVKGANDYFTASAGGKKPGNAVEGIKVIDPLTIQITLEEPNSMFLYNLARPGAFIFPKEAFEKYGLDMRTKTVGTGPFMLQSVDADNQIILGRNENYHGVDEFGNKLPFFDAINVRFLQDKKVELLEFKKGNLDMMYRLPTDYIIEILAESGTDAAGGYSKYDLQRDPEMSTQMLILNNQHPVLKNLDVRKALNFAIDRQKILDYVLNGEGYMEGYHGVTPPAFKNYDITKISGFRYNVDSAKYYLSKAGYPNGKGFPKLTLDLNPEGERYTNVALEVQHQLQQNLNIQIDMQILPLAQIAEKSMAGKYAMLRLAWIADYPSPENYLWAFYGKTIPDSEDEDSYPNLSRYSNPAFDKLYEAALRAETDEEAMQYFHQAEKLLMKDAPAIVLWYDEGYRLLQSNVKNFPNNPMQFRDFAEVYMVPVEETN